MTICNYEDKEEKCNFKATHGPKFGEKRPYNIISIHDNILISFVQNLAQ